MATATKRQAISWGRFSSDKQSDGDSRDRQERLNKECAKRLGIELIAYHFDEGVSVKEGVTPKFKAVLKSLPEGVGIICEDLDRINRAHAWKAKAYILELVEAGHFVITSADGVEYNKESINNPNTLIVGDVKSTIAYGENRKRIARVREEMEKAIDNVRKGIPTQLGAWMPSHVFFNTETRNYEVKEDVKATIARIFSLYNQGEGYGRIAKVLNEDGVLTTRRKKVNGWDAASVGKILRNDGYIGHFTFRGETFKSIFPPAIPESVFYEAQARLERNSKRHGNYSGRVLNIFRGLLKCKGCGRAINVHLNTRGVTYYYCRYGLFKGCQAKHLVPHSMAEMLILAGIVERVKEQLTGNDETYKKIQTLEAKKKDIESKITDTLTLLDKGLALAQVEERLRKLKAEQESITNKIASLNATNATLKNVPTNVQELEQLLDTARTDDNTRRKISNLLPNLLTHIVVDIRNKEVLEYVHHFTNGTTGHGALSIPHLAKMEKQERKGAKLSSISLGHL